MRRLIGILGDRGCWSWSIGYLVLLLSICSWLVIKTWSGWTVGTLGIWFTAVGSLSWLPWLAMGCAMPGRFGGAVRVAAIGIAILFCAWFVASVEMFTDQGHAFDFAELRQQLRNVVSRAIIFETLASLRMAVFAACCIGIILLARRLAQLLAQRTQLALSLGILVGMMFSGALSIGTNVFGDIDYYAARQLPMSAPWSFVHRFTCRSGQASGLHCDPRVAKRERAELDPVIWGKGSDPILAPLAGRYIGRKIVVIVMESQRFSNIDRLGRSAAGYRPRSPFLSSLADRGMFFTNYIQSGPGTIFAQFSILTGITPGLNFYVDNEEELYPMAKLGPIPDFQRAGYLCEWLQCTDARFAGFDRFLAEVDVPWWFSKDETKDADRRYWTNWGIPDEQLYEVAWKRYRSHLYDATPRLQMLLTISNHQPFAFPPRLGDTVLPADHEGGMRYADACLRTFVGHLLGLPPELRPLIFITADHSFRMDLNDAKPLGADGLESIRIPGCLVLPDECGAGQICDSLFTHQDLLDLMLMLTTRSERPGVRKFIDAHRLAAPTVVSDEHSIVMQNAFLYAPTGRCYGVHNTWTLDDALEPALRDQVRVIHDSVQARSDAMWMGGGKR